MILLTSSLANIGIQFVAGLFQLPPDIVASQIPMVAPLPSSAVEIAHRQAVDDLLSDKSDIWRNNLGYMLEEDVDSKIVNDKMKILEASSTSTDSEKEEKPYKPATYGEITTVGARQLYFHMGMKGSFKSCGSNDKDTVGADDYNSPADKKAGKIVFCDMGSGVGRFVMQTFMEMPRVSKSLGIELAPLRHQHAVTAWDQLKSKAENIRNDINCQDGGSIVEDATVEFVQADFLEADLSEVTHMYVSSLCFTEDMMYELAAKLEHGAPNLQCVATLRSFPKKFEKKGILDRKSYEVVHKLFGTMILRTEYVDMSWTSLIGNGNAVYVYTKPPPI